MAFYLDESAFYFPHPNLSDESGLLCMGGNMSVNSLILSYKYGIFPWFNQDSPILWWSPNPRAVLFPNEIKISKSMRPYFNQRKFQISYDHQFQRIIEECAHKFRKGQESTWITDEVMQAYCDLHDAGYAHSVEVYIDSMLVGGLYGVGLHRVFYGESMFAHMSNASKFGFISLVKELQRANFSVIDCQQNTGHLNSLGSRVISRDEFLKILKQDAIADPYYLFWNELKERGIH